MQQSGAPRRAAGQAIVVMALAIGVIVMSVGLAVDGGPLVRLYLSRRPEFVGPGTVPRFLTTGDPRAVSDRATQFLKRRIAFETA